MLNMSGLIRSSCSRFCSSSICPRGSVWLSAALFITMSIVCAELSAQVKLGDDLIIKGPNEVEFVFRPIPLGIKENMRISGIEYTMGDPALGFKAFPAKVSLGGCFVAPSPADPSQKEWVYYLGKYELTEEQYYAVMNPDGAQPDKSAGKKPMAGLTYYEVLAFLDKLNIWLLKNAAGQLPHLNDAPGFIRLPTEAEWEFAARGGLAVPSDIRSSAHPYTDGLEDHEWFAGPKSSHNQVQPVGRLKPNPLGLYDMLGNVSEMTNNLYQLEYYQGRSGGLTARGGHFLTNERDLNAALRIEEPFYLGDKKRGMKPNKKPTLGLRLAIGSPIMTDRGEIAVLEEAWDEHKDSAGRAASPAGLSTAPIGVKTGLKAGDARGHLANARARLAAGGELSSSFIDPISRDLGFLEASLTDIDLIRKKGESDSASSWIRIGVFVAQYYGKEKGNRDGGINYIATLKKTPGNEDRIKRIEERLPGLNANMAELLTAYHDSLSQLATLDSGVVFEALIRHRDELEKKQSVPERAIKACDLLERHYKNIIVDKVVSRKILSNDLDSLVD